MTSPTSERRLHPIALLLFLGSQLRELAFGIAALLFASRSDGLLGGIIGGAVSTLLFGLLIIGPAVSRLLTFRYRYEPDELVLRWGLLFRKVRHIPFARIQSLDAREMLLHRWTGTVAVKVETGGGAETDGDIAAIPREAFEEMRSRVLLEKAGPVAAPDAGALAPEEQLAHLTTKELLLTGLINNRGMVVVAGMVAIVFDWGFGDQLLGRWFGPEVAERGSFHTAFQLLRGSIDVTPRGLLLAGLGVLLFLLVVRLLSLVFTVFRFHDHRLVRIGDDLRVTCGLITRSTSTTPLRRIQTLTIRDGPWHRMAGRVTVQAATAGGVMFSKAVASRETLAPLLHRGSVPHLLTIASSGLTLPDGGWHPAAPPARRRAVTRTAMVWAIPLGIAWLIGTPAVVLATLCAVLGLVASLGRVATYRWIAFDGGIALRTGWLWRRTTVARDDRIQATVLAESPFDRRHGMAWVSVDTAGSEAPALDFDKLTRPDAEALAARLQRSTAMTAFRT